VASQGTFEPRRTRNGRLRLQLLCGLLTSSTLAGCMSASGQDQTQPRTANRSTADLNIVSQTPTITEQTPKVPSPWWATPTPTTRSAPAHVTRPYLQRTGGYALANGATYGVGIVPVVHFDESITNKAAAEKALLVTSTPHVDGSWFWVDDQNVHYRPRDYWPSGAHVTVSANVYDVDVGSGFYGESDVTASFTIGARQVSIADDQRHTVSVYVSDQLVRTMPTSMGRHTTVQSPRGPVSFWTMNGTYTVIEHDNPAIMSSASYGLPANAPGGYPPEAVYYATKISTDGIYLHELDSTVRDQGRRDVSHGCLNLNKSNAVWYYNHSQIGDVVQVNMPGAPGIRLWQNGDWSVPWETWLAGSAAGPGG
jgi:lipoprotein-anchoring transpeptidase ErfK/SrfK